MCDVLSFAAAAAAESVISIYTAELLPTSCRSSVMGICSQASRLGSVTAPFLLMAGAQLGSVGGHSQASAATSVQCLVLCLSASVPPAGSCLWGQLTVLDPMWQVLKPQSVKCTCG